MTFKEYKKSAYIYISEAYPMFKNTDNGVVELGSVFADNECLASFIEETFGKWIIAGYTKDSIVLTAHPCIWAYGYEDFLQDMEVAEELLNTKLNGVRWGELKELKEDFEIKLAQVKKIYIEDTKEDDNENL